MGKLLKYIAIVCLIFIIGFIAFKCFNKSDKVDNLGNKNNTNQEVFEDPETIVYQIKGKEKFTLTKEDEEYSEILNKLNSSLVDGYTSREVAGEKGWGLPLLIIDIQEEIYSKYSTLKLIYNENYEIDVILDEPGVLDVIYVENNIYDSYYAFDETTKKEIKEFIDSII